MFDYEPEYAKELRAGVGEIKSSKLQHLAMLAVEKYVNEKTIEEFSEKYESEGYDEKHNALSEKYKYVDNELTKIYQILGYRYYIYISDIIYDILEAVEERIQEEAPSVYSIFLHEIPIEKRYSFRYKPTFEYKSPQMCNAIISGLCCSLCSHYVNGKCHNPIYSEFEFPDVEAWQICECMLFDGQKYGDYYFNGVNFTQKKTKRTREHFAQIAKTINKAKSSMSENEDFICFIRKEIPDVYRKLRQEYKRRKEIMK